MKKLITAILLAAVLAGSTSCKKDLIGEGKIITETRSVTNFTGIDLRMNGNVYYKNDPSWKVEVTAKQSIHAMLETNVVNNHLVVRYSNGKTYDADESIRINVSGPGVSSFELNSSGNIRCLDAIQSSSLSLRSGGSGNIYMQHVESNVIEAESLVSGQIIITGGTTINEKLKTDGSGRIDFTAMSAKNASARIIGSGDISVKVSEKLDATIDGSGSVYFRGNPFVTSHLHGTGRLIRF